MSWQNLRKGAMHFPHLPLVALGKRILLHLLRSLTGRFPIFHMSLHLVSDHFPHILLRIFHNLHGIFLTLI